MPKDADPAPAPAEQDPNTGTAADAGRAGDPGLPAAPDAPNADVAWLGYEQARDELVDIVARLENGQAGLEDSMRLWERGEALAAHCARWLDRAEERIAAAEE